MSFAAVFAVTAAFVFFAPVQRIDASMPAYPCPSLNNCTLNCQYGLAYGAYDCQICQCLEPCKDVTCELDEVCTVQEVQCVRAPCPPQGICTPKPQPCPELIDCWVDCQYGLAYDENECPVCRCLQPCQNVTCGENEACTVQEVHCIRAPCPPLGLCTPKQPSCPSMDGCMLDCNIGFAYDENECSICECLQPCKNVTCAFNEECQIQAVQCIRAPCPPIGVCTPKTSGSTPFRQGSTPLIQGSTPLRQASTPSPVSCPKLECELIRCQYGFKYDQTNCQTCLCYDPCEGYQCPTGQKCFVQTFGCMDDVNCRGEWQRSCVVDTPAPVTRNIPTAQELMSCCSSNNMAENCTFLCVPDLKVTVENVKTVLQCLDQLPIYRSCAGGNQVWYTGCCQETMPGTYCDVLCAGNSTVDSSYLQRFTSCLLSEYINDALACIQRGNPDAVTSMTTPPYGGTTRTVPMVCLQPPVVGPCKAHLETWYYNHYTDKCEIFYYGGCSGNENNFATKEACEAACRPTAPPCPEIMCGVGCDLVVGRDGCNTCSCNNSCPTVRCSRQCQYGVQKDANGCNSCDCVDPCISVTCPYGYVCTYKQEPVCEDDICQISYRGQCTASTVGCPTMNCSNTCSYGRVKDSNRCDTCECANPCKDVTCEIGYMCKIVSALTCAGETCEMRHVGMCAVECLPPPCPELTSCEYGYVKDSNDCDTCTCNDPCKDVTCRPGQVCVRKTVPTYVGEGGAVKEVFVGQCEQQPTCAGYICEIFCKHGHMLDTNGCPMCQCFDPCKDVTCGSNSVCQPRLVEKTPANPYGYIGECVECSGPACFLPCQYGFVRPTSNCSLCQCFEPCKEFNCSANQHCAITPVQPTDFNLQSFQGQCVDDIICSRPLCDKSLHCDYGLIKDGNGCESCQCFDPCLSVVCGEGKHCEATGIAATREYPYSYIGRCVQNEVCSPIMCEMYCKYSFKKNNKGCPICECYDPCGNVTCEDSSMSQCHPRIAERTPTQPYDYIGECIQCTGMACRIACDYGTVMVTNTCPLCECFDPCKEANCSSSQKCVVKEVQPSEDYLQSYMAQCEEGCRPMGRMCPYCQYGYEMDSNGCQTCDCYNPCSLVDCRDGMICQPVPDPQCSTGSCRYTASCVAQQKQCGYDMQQNLKRYAQNLAEMPELNCDLDGYYKPMQCDHNYESCYCTTPEGKTSYANLNLIEAVEMCFPAERILGTLKIEANFSVIVAGQGPFFKQTIAYQLAVRLFANDDLNVTITAYYPGSIMADFVIANQNKSMVDIVEKHIEGLMVGGNNGYLPMEYSGVTYDSRILNYRRFGSFLPVTTPHAPRPGSGRYGELSRGGFLVLVILLPIVGALLLAAIIAFCVYKMCQRRGSFEPMSNRSSMSFDTVMEKGKAPKTSGYDNPNYEPVKVPLE